MSEEPHEALREELGEVPFSVSARVAIQLGRESISSSIVAILELVKNAYDADAENVEIRFHGLDTQNPILIIEDDGIGMTKQELLDHWMVLGTSVKLMMQKSRRKGRVLIGEKGLGRLGLDRLSKTCVVQSFSREEDTGVELLVDWTRYEDTNDRLETIKHHIFRIDKIVQHPITSEIEKKSHGTRLILNGLKDIWSDDDIVRLQRELTLLVSPFEGINDFAIWFYSGMGLIDIDGRVGSEELLEAAEWQMVSGITPEGVIYHVMTHREGAEFKFSEPWKKVFPKRGTLPRCGPLKFEVYFFPRVAVKELSLTKQQLQTFLDANQGIRIYRDKFRVKPYGEPSGEGDWLNLALRRVRDPGGVRQRGLWRVAYNQVVGAVFLEREKNSTLLDQTNREGIVEGPAFFDLRHFALHTVEFFERRRQEYERSQSRRTRIEKALVEAQSTSTSASIAVNNLVNAVTTVVDILDKGKTPDEAIELSSIRGVLLNSVTLAREAVVDVKEAQEEVIAATEEEQRGYEEQKNTLGNLASLGILAASFGHETLRHTYLVVNNVELLKEYLDIVLPTISKELMTRVKASMESIEFAAKRIQTFADFTLKHIRRDKREKTWIYLDKLAGDVITQFSETLVEKQGIEIIWEIPKKTPHLRGFIIDWESILINLITNAVWALENTPRDKRKIRLRLLQIDSQLKLSFGDSGCGIEAGIIDHIFEPTFSTKRNPRGDIIGTGMGLSILENLIVENYGGSIKVDQYSDLGGAEFHIIVPLPKDQKT